MTDSPPSPTPLQAAQARIAATRGALRKELLGPGHPKDDPDTATRPLQRSWRRWRRRLRHWPLAGVALQAVQGWWQRHPLQPVGQLLGQQLSTQVLPLVRRHPRTSVAVAAAVGGLVMAARPWRWPAVSAVFRPLPGQAGRVLQDLLSSPTLHAALAAWLATVLRQAAPAEPAPQADAAGGAAAAAAPSPSAAAGGNSAVMQVP